MYIGDGHRTGTPPTPGDEDYDTTSSGLGGSDKDYFDDDHYGPN
jgi:hypothetical protein